MVKSNSIYSPQAYVAALTGKCYTIGCDKIEEEIEEILKANGYAEGQIWSYPLTEIDHIVENNLNVVLVDLSYYNAEHGLIPNYRWYEVSEDFDEVISSN